MYNRRMDLNEIAVFVKVVQTGSFTLAARELKMPNSTVSAKVSALEKRLGVTLIRRTTRRLSVTPAGQAYFKRCIQGLGEIEGAEAELVATLGEAQGLLRVTAPVELGSSMLPGLVQAFTKAHPKVRVEVILTDRRVELLSENIDLAIRAGELRDSSLVAKKLGLVYFALFASPRYLKANGEPKHPRDLRQHECVHFTPIGFEQWTLTGARGTVHVPVPARLIMNDLNMVKAMAVAGAGITLLPTFFCYPELKAEKLVRVLGDWRTNEAPVHFVYPAQRFVTPKLTAFIELATPSLRESLHAHED